MKSAAAWTATMGVTDELVAIRGRTRRGVGVSLVAHAALLLFLKLTASDATPTEGLVEVTWIETPVPASAPASAPAARETPTSHQEKRIPVRPSPTPESERFVRAMPRAETAPQPQRRTTSRDAVRERLATVGRTSPEARTRLAALLPGAGVSRAVPAAAPPVRDADAGPRSLVRTRSSGPSRAPAQLVRASSDPAPATAALARLVDEPVVAAPPPTSSAAAFPPREVLAGVSLAGPVADRALVHWRLPVYPEWAKREAIEGSVRLRFVVRPDGGVKEDIMVERTSGYGDFDRNATVAVLDWLFEPLPGATGVQWGSITLDYRLDSLH